MRIEVGARQILPFLDEASRAKGMATQARQRLAGVGALPGLGVACEVFPTRCHDNFEKGTDRCHEAFYPLSFSQSVRSCRATAADGMALLDNSRSWPSARLLDSNSILLQNFSSTGCASDAA